MQRAAYVANRAPFGIVVTGAVHRRLDKADGSDADQVLLVCGRSVVFLRCARHEAQIVPDEFIPRRHVAVLHRLECCDLVPRGKRLRETAAFQGAVRNIKSGLRQS